MGAKFWSTVSFTSLLRWQVTSTWAPWLGPGAAGGWKDCSSNRREERTSGRKQNWGSVLGAGRMGEGMWCTQCPRKVFFVCVFFFSFFFFLERVIYLTIYLTICILKKKTQKKPQQVLARRKLLESKVTGCWYRQQWAGQDWRKLREPELSQELYPVLTKQHKRLPINEVQPFSKWQE